MKHLFLTLWFLIVCTVGYAQIPQTVWTSGNGMLTFCYKERLYEIGGDLNDEEITKVWSGNHLTDFSEIKERIELITFDVSFKKFYLKTAEGLFENCENLRLIFGIENFRTDSAVSMSRMFNGCVSLMNLDVSGFKTENAGNMKSMFKRCMSLTKLDVSGFDTQNVTDMESMFEGCVRLKDLDVRSFDTRKVTDMVRMFADCAALTELSAGGFKTGNVTAMTAMFAGCNSLKKLDVSGFDTHGVRDMSFMFGYCNALESLDVRSFNTQNVASMSGMFTCCKSLKKLDARSFDTRNVTDMSNMFYACSSLTEAGTGGFNTGKVTDMSQMFAWCVSLPEAEVGGFNTGSAVNLSSMFAYCRAMKRVDVSGFDTENVTDLSYMFYNCSSLTSLNVGSFDIKNVTEMNGIFSGCSRLETIYCNRNWQQSLYISAHMFEGCYRLSGAAVFDSEKTDISMANPKTGYFYEIDDKITVDTTRYAYGRTWSESGLNPKEYHLGELQNGKFQYLLDGKDVTNAVSSAGQYNLVIRFVSDDNKIDYKHKFEITVIPPEITARYKTSMKYYCGGSQAEIIFSGIETVPATHYSVDFSDAAFKSAEHAVFESDRIVFDVPKTIQYGDYQAYVILFNDNANAKSKVMTVDFSVSPSNLKTKWDDVVYVPNPDNEFSSYQWYKNGGEISGATKQFFNEVGGLDGVYYVVIKTSDGREIQTCPLKAEKQTDASAPNVSVFPNPAKAGQKITLKLENMDVAKNIQIMVFTSAGLFVKRIDNAQNTNSLTLSKGGYVGYADYAGEKIAFKIVVEK